MPHDFKHKEPSKTEKILYELMMSQQGMERALWSNSSLIMAMAILQDIKPEKIADLLVSGDEKIKSFSKLVNEEIKKLEAAKQPEQAQAESGDKQLDNETA